MLFGNRKQAKSQKTFNQIAFYGYENTTAMAFFPLFLCAASEKNYKSESRIPRTQKIQGSPVSEAQRRRGHEVSGELVMFPYLLAIL